MVRVAGRVKEVREKQPRKALLSMVVARAAAGLRSMREERGPRRPKGHVVGSQSRRHHPASAPVGKRSGYKSTRTKLVEILQKH